MKQFIKNKLFKYLCENKYLNPEYRKAVGIYDVPVEFMWNYREFDRCGDDNIWGSEYINNLTADIKEKGIETPIILQIDGSVGLITEGNHRLCIAINLGFDTIPVQVINRTLGGPNKSKAKPIHYHPNKWRVGVWD